MVIIMDDVLKLAMYYNDCPKCWRNFIVHLENKHTVEDGQGIDNELINEELKEFGGFYLNHVSHIPYVMFNSPEYKTLFMLKYV
jgi:hypothetical protein